MNEELVVLKAQWFDLEMQIRNAIQIRSEVEKRIIAICEAPTPSPVPVEVAPEVAE